MGHMLCIIIFKVSVDICTVMYYDKSTKRT